MRHERACHVDHRVDGTNSELYIDEAFAHLTGVPGDLTAFGRRIRANILKCTGIPVGVGIGPTKTLAKLANHTAKRLLSHTGGVVDICDVQTATGYCVIRRSQRSGG